MVSLLKNLCMKLIPAAILCCSFAYSIDTEIFIKAGERVNGFSGLTLGENGHLFLCNGLYKNIVEFNPVSQQFIDVLFQSKEFSFLDDIVTIPAEFSDSVGGQSFTGFLDGRVTTVLNDGTVIDSNPGPFIPCSTCGNSGITFDPDLLGVNPITYRKSNDRLYVSSNFNATRIFKLDWRGTSPKEAIILNPAQPSNLNGFSFGPDDKLYAPLPNSNKVVKIDADTGDVTDLITNIPNPIAVKVDDFGVLFIVSRSTGKLFKFDPTSNSLSELATLEPALDNLVIDNEKRFIYVTNDQNEIFRVKADSGEVKRLFTAPIRGPGELALINNSLFFADTSCIKETNATTARIKRNLVIASAESALSSFGILISISVEGDDVANGKIIAIDVQGNIGVINKSDFSLHEFFPFFLTGLIGKQPFSAVRVLDGAGEYYLVTNVVDGKVIKLSRQSGNIVIEDFLTGLIAPVKVKSHNGFLYVVEAGNLLNNVPNTGRVRKVAINNPADQTILLENLDNPQGLDIYGNKMVIVEVGRRRVIEANANHPSSPHVIHRRLKTGLSPLASPFNPVPIQSFTGVAVNSDGSRIYVTQNIPNNILLIKR